MHFYFYLYTILVLKQNMVGYLRVKAPGAPHSVTGLASWYMGSGFSVGGAVVFVYLTSVISLTSPP